MSHMIPNAGTIWQTWDRDFTYYANHPPTLPNLDLAHFVGNTLMSMSSCRCRHARLISKESKANEPEVPLLVSRITNVHILS